MFSLYHTEVLDSAGDRARDKLARLTDAQTNCVTIYQSICHGPYEYNRVLVSRSSLMGSAPKQGIYPNCSLFTIILY